MAEMSVCTYVVPSKIDTLQWALVENAIVTPSPDLEYIVMLISDLLLMVC